MRTPSAPPDALVKRFRDDLIALTGAMPPHGRIGVAVSGGPDSLALLLLARAAMPGCVFAATVDHGLRQEAAEEAAMVGRVCGGLGVQHFILSRDRQPALVPGSARLRALAQEVEWMPDQVRHDGKGTGNVQHKARMLRYGLLADWAAREAIPVIATAHHCDDVAESFLMRALRGAGVSGLARMKARTRLPYAQAEVMLVRPLLNWRSAELSELVRASGLIPAQDPSNRDERFDRARIRALLQREPALDPLALARSAANLADADAAIEWMVEQAWRSRADHKPDAILIDAEDLPDEIRRRLAARALTLFAENWNGEGLDRLMTTLDAGGTGTLAGVRAIGGRPWRFTVAPPRRGHR